MLRKCSKQVIYAVISPLSHQSGTVYPASHLFSQQKINFNWKGAKTEEELKSKPSSFISAGLNSTQSESFETSQTEKSGLNLGRVHGFKGEERAYFVFVAGLLLLFNVTARLTIKHDPNYHSYEKSS